MSGPSRAISLPTSAVTATMVRKVGHAMSGRWNGQRPRRFAGAIRLGRCVLMNQ